MASIIGQLKMWDGATGKTLHSFGDSIRFFAFSPDSAHVLGSDNEGIKIWDAKTGALQRTFVPSVGSIQALAVSPDGARVVSTGDQLMLWDVASGRLLRTYAGGDRSEAVAFSADGKNILTANEKTVRVWSITTGAVERTFQGHSGTVNSVAFSTDGRRIVSGSKDATMKLWDARTGHELAAMVTSREGDWVTLTPLGFFNGSGKISAEAASIVRGLDVITIGQVWQSLFNPDLVRAALASDPDGEVRDAANFVALDRIIDSGPAPFVRITSHPSKTATLSELLPDEVTISDRGKGVGRVEWRVNGITSAVGSGGKHGSIDRRIAQVLPLEPGDNIIEVVAYVRGQVLCDSLRFSRREALARLLFQLRRPCAGASIVFA